MPPYYLGFKHHYSMLSNSARRLQLIGMCIRKQPTKYVLKTKAPAVIGFLELGNQKRHLVYNSHQLYYKTRQY